MKMQSVIEPSFRQTVPESIDLARVAILLDVDGTIVDVAATPQSVVIPPSLVQTLTALHTKTGGALALVSGRLVENLDHLFSPLLLPCIGGHGVEMRSSAFASLHRRAVELSPIIKKQLVAAAAVDPRIIIEDKGSSLAVHFRLAPEQAPLMKNKIAAIIDHSGMEGLEMLCGKAVIEIKPRAFNKGTAVCELMRIPPFAERTPIFVGDDVTDESVFAVMPALGGCGYSVGRQVNDICGLFKEPREVREWLADLAEAD
ncbi:MAG: trehalose-phosphatase [Xanthobacteraceae bacterium]|nr:trehalose-phosphatase [Xanthobacteraceae bacterium]